MTQISTQPCVADNSDHDGNNTSHGSTGNFFQNLNSSQYQQVINLLFNHLTAITTGRPNESSDVPSASYHIGTCFSVSMKQNLTTAQFRIVDFGASRHICSYGHAFNSLHPIQNFYVTLPNSTSIPVFFSGDITLSVDLTLQDMLYVP